MLKMNNLLNVLQKIQPLISAEQQCQIKCKRLLLNKTSFLRTYIHFIVIIYLIKSVCLIGANAKVISLNEYYRLQQPEVSLRNKTKSLLKN